MAKDKAGGIKSAYELALERLQSEGIAPPRQDAVSDETRAAIAEARGKADAKLAELEILHRDRLKKLGDPAARQEEEEQYREERRRIEAARERKVEALRRPAGED